MHDHSDCRDRGWFEDTRKLREIYRAGLVRKDRVRVRSLSECEKGRRARRGAE